MNEQDLENIKGELVSIKQGSAGAYQLKIKNFEINMYPIGNSLRTAIDKNYTIDIYLYFRLKDNDFTNPLGWDDWPIKGYKPIQYKVNSHFSNNYFGRNMPILQLCELIYYLRKLSKMNSFW